MTDQWEGDQLERNVCIAVGHQQKPPCNKTAGQLCGTLTTSYVPAARSTERWSRIVNVKTVWKDGTFKWGTQICVIRQFVGIWRKVQIKPRRNGTLQRILTVETDRNTESGVTKMEEIRRASFSLFHHISPRSSCSLSPGTSLTTRAKSTAAIDDAMKCMDWTPILGGSHYSLNRLGVSKSPTTSLKHDVIINIEDTGNNDELVFVSSVSDPY